MRILGIEYSPLFDPKVAIRYRDMTECETTILRLSPGELIVVQALLREIDNHPDRFPDLHRALRRAFVTKYTDQEESR